MYSVCAELYALEDAHKRICLCAWLLSLRMCLKRCWVGKLSKNWPHCWRVVCLPVQCLALPWLSLFRSRWASLVCSSSSLFTAAVADRRAASESRCGLSLVILHSSPWGLINQLWCIAVLVNAPSFSTFWGASSHSADVFLFSACAVLFDWCCCFWFGDPHGVRVVLGWNYFFFWIAKCLWTQQGFTGLLVFCWRCGSFSLWLFLAQSLFCAYAQCSAVEGRLLSGSVSWV